MAEKNVNTLRKFPFLGRRQVPYETFVRELGRKSTSFSVNPGLKINPAYLITYSGLSDWEKNWKKNQVPSYAELGQVKIPARLEFRNYLPQDPEVIRRGCGPGGIRR